MATKIATKKAVEAMPKVIPPSSPFASLLRQSKFAAFDPTIRQTYGAPASHIHRGNYGLKRNINVRKKPEYITLKNYEEHAQYIEWSGAQGQVSFVKRVEEANVQPSLVANTPWYTGLGPVAVSSASGIDSEFCPGEGTGIGMSRKERNKAAALESPSPSAPPTLTLDNFSVKLGHRGRGEYGSRPSAQYAESKDGDAFTQPNILAMSPRVFNRYLEKLRELRPEFVAYLEKQIRLRRAQNARREGLPEPDPNAPIDIAELAAEGVNANLHMMFLGKNSEAQFHASAGDESSPSNSTSTHPNAPQPIRQQPHKYAGLMYSAPTLLESRYTSRPEPGIILQSSNPASDRYTNLDNPYVAAFAGMTAQLRKSQAGPSVAVVYDPTSETGIQLSDKPNAVSDENLHVPPSRSAASEKLMRMTTLELEAPPQVVGRHTSDKPLLATHVRPHVVVESAVDQNWRENPHAPGTMEYNGMMPRSGKFATGVRSSTLSMMNNNARMRGRLGANPIPTKGSLNNLGKGGKEAMTFDLLQTLVNPQNSASFFKTRPVWGQQKPSTSSPKAEEEKGEKEP
ncbi:hypothetical protein CVT24_009249 [Panaeolus cyanescens]|uniref:Uncharacterized protein n=1 Tax=Panaeolus cyanescens TaxID=181874 RepID=A0A409Y8D3_9AGAR|nr:hypothetical protein CVT24_009249 [Panaeolus cyanescens]